MVASDTKGPQFDCQLCVEKTKIKKKEARNGPFFNKLDFQKFGDPATKFFCKRNAVVR